MSNGGDKDPIEKLALSLAIVVREDSESANEPVVQRETPKKQKKQQVIEWKVGELTYGQALKDVSQAEVKEGNTVDSPVYSPPLDAKLIGFGDHTLTLVVPENEDYDAARLSVPLHVKRAKLTVSVRDHQVEQGKTPNLAFDSDGLVGTDAIEVDFKHDFTSSSPPDLKGLTVEIEAVNFDSGVKQNYDITTVPGRLVVTRTLGDVDGDITQLRHISLRRTKQSRIEDPDFKAIEKSRLDNDLAKVEKLISDHHAKSRRALGPDIDKFKRVSGELTSASLVTPLDVAALDKAFKGNEFDVVEELLAEFTGGAVSTLDGEITKLRRQTLELASKRHGEVVDFDAIETARDSLEFAKLEKLISEAQPKLLEQQGEDAIDKKRESWERKLKKVLDRIDKFTPTLHPKIVQDLKKSTSSIETAIPEVVWADESQPDDKFIGKFTSLDEALCEQAKAAEKWLADKDTVPILKRKIAGLKTSLAETLSEGKPKAELKKREEKIEKAKTPDNLLKDDQWRPVLWAHNELIDWLKDLSKEEGEGVSPLVARMNKFKHTDPTTWELHSVRYLNKTKGQIEATVGADTKVNDLSTASLYSNTTAGGSVLKTDFEGHTHLDGGSGGMAFIYKLNDDFTVTPYVVDVSTSRGGKNGNQYKWLTGGSWAYYPTGGTAPGSDNTSGGT